MSTTEENKAILRRWLEEFWNQGNDSLVEELVSPSFTNHPAGNVIPANDPEALRNQVVNWRATFPGQMTIDSIIAEEDLVAARLTWRGVHQGEFMGIPPTGKPIELTLMAFERFDENGKMAQGWGEFDMLRLLQQIGVPLEQATRF
jgi:predicted ester cyclase